MSSRASSFPGTDRAADEPQTSVHQALPTLDPAIVELKAITLAGLRAILTNPATPPREFRLTAAVALRFITAAERALSASLPSSRPPRPSAQAPTAHATPPISPEPPINPQLTAPSQPSAASPPSPESFAPLPLNPPPTRAAALMLASGSAHPLALVHHYLGVSDTPADSTPSAGQTRARSHAATDKPSALPRILISTLDPDVRLIRHQQPRGSSHLQSTA